jgi:hypothetical protein
MRDGLEVPGIGSLIEVKLAGCAGTDGAAVEESCNWTRAGASNRCGRDGRFAPRLNDPDRHIVAHRS